MEKLEEHVVCRSPHRLSLCGKVMSFRSNKDSERNATGLTFCTWSFKREDNAFLKAADDDGVAVTVTGGKASPPVDVVKCKCVIDVRRRVRTPCVLAARKSQKGGSFKYSLFTQSSSDQLEPCVAFKLPYEMRDNVSILQGPTVLWTHAGDVFYTSLQAGGVRQIPVQLSHIVVGELPLHKGQVFVLGLQKEISKEQSNSTVCTQTLGYFVEDGHVFDGSLILPRAFMCITRCVLVLSAERVDSVLRSAVVAATSNRQLVYFEDGAVRDMCQLPFEGPEDIQVVNTGRNGCLFSISFAQGHVCAVWKETFQVASHWSGVSTVHVDDFLGCGTDQMLLVFKDQGVEGQQLDNFLITDLCGTSYSRNQENGHLQTSHHPSENYLLTLHALEARLESGLTTLQELQREVSVKERVLLQSVKALTDVVSAREPVFTQFEQENLIPLWDCDDDDDESTDGVLDDKMHDMPAVPSKPQIDKLWHRVIEDQMVVGVILTTDSSIPLDSVSLSILTEAGQTLTPAVIQTQSQVFLLPTFSSSPSMLPEPAAKRSKQHNADSPHDPNACRLAVTAVTRLTPLLNSGFVKCPVMLHYVQRQHQDSSPLVSTPTPVVLHCGQAALDIHSDFPTQLLSNPKLRTDEVREDFLSLLAVLDHWTFAIDSPDHSLGDVDGWIKGRVGCEMIELSPQYLLFNSSAPSALMLLRWHQTTPFHGELSVHSSQVRMLQFLDSLLSYLPASCSIQPLKCARGEGASQISAFSLALEKEVLSLREGVTSLLCEKAEDEERSSSTGLRHEQTPEPGSVGLLQCREAWQRDSERTRVSPLVDIAKYRRLIQSLSKVQLNVDMAALLDTQRGLFC